MTDQIIVRRQAMEPKRFAAVELTSPGGRPLMLFAEPWYGRACTDEPRINLWADIETMDNAKDWDAEYDGRDKEVEELEAKLDAIADRVLATYGCSEHATLEALAAGLTLVLDKQVGIAEVLTAVESDKERYEADRERFLKPICQDAYDEILENEERGYGFH